MMKRIEIEGLTRDYGGGKGVFDLSLAIEEGQIYGFLGPNGAGKTTALRHLMGFLRPRTGRVLIDGQDCFRNRDSIQREVGYVAGEISFLAGMTGKEYLDFIGRYRGGRSERKQELLDRFELATGGKIRKMSKGMKQKLGIVAAWMHDPQILILDEPTGGLDPLMQRSFIELLREEKERGKTILLSSHLFEEVEQTCDRIGMIRGGRLVANDTAEALRSRHTRTYQVELADEQLAAAFAADFNGSRDGRTVTLTAAHDLEKIFMQYYGGEVK